jgi:hypothetical protein
MFTSCGCHSHNLRIKNKSRCENYLTDEHVV